MKKVKKDNRFFKAVKILSTRSLLFYLLIIICSFFIVDYDAIKTGEMIRSNKFLEPSTYSDLVSFIDHDLGLNKKVLKKYFFYYKKYIEFMPESPDAYSMLGFCSYYLGKNNKAVKAYEKAISINDTVFWPYYNLAVILYKKGDYSSVIKLCESAVGKDPKNTVSQYVNSKKVFLPIIKEKGLDVFSMLEDLKGGYRDCYLLLIDSNKNINNYGDMLIASKNAVKANVGSEGIFYYYQGVSLFYLKKYKEAITLLNKSLELEPYNSEAYDYLSKSFKELEMTDLQLESMKKEKELKGKMRMPDIGGLGLRFL